VEHAYIVKWTSRKARRMPARKFMATRRAQVDTKQKGSKQELSTQEVSLMQPVDFSRRTDV
jgi:hypothetical protein